jgi:hypothetical protein
MKKAILIIGLFTMFLISPFDGKSQFHKVPYKGKYFSIAAGIGQSYGWFGFRGQYRYGNTVGVGIHTGAGTTCYGLGYSGGIKLFPYRDLIYLNIQYGVVGLVGGSSNEPDNWKYVHGTSFLVGTDWIFWRKIGMGINFAIGTTYIHNQNLKHDVDGTYDFAADMGIIYKF